MNDVSNILKNGRSEQRMLAQILAALFLLVVAFSIYNIYFHPMLVDDAYIGFRVAKNFAAGNGLVYNPNEHIMTSTTSLYALLNGILWTIFGDHTIICILLLNIVWHAATTCFLFCFVRKALLSKYAGPGDAYVSALFAALFFVFSSAVSLIATCGMETPLYTFFICLSFYFYFENKLSISVLVSAIPFLIRPEGCLVAMVIMLFVLIEHRRVYVSHLSIITIAVVPYLLILYSYYGTVIPQSIPAKHLYNLQHGQEIREFLLTYFFSVKRLPLGFFFFSGLYYSIRFNRKLLPFVVWGFVYACFFTLIASWWKWYKPPFYMVYSCVIAMGVYFWVEFLCAKYPARKLISWSPYLLSVGLLIAAFVNHRETLGEYSKVYQGFLAGSRNIAGVILQNTSKDQIIMVEPLGFIGFYTFERRFKDYPGLCSPEVVASLKTLGRKLNGTLSDYEALQKLNNDIRPDIFVLRQREYDINKEKGTISNYRIVADVPMEFQHIDYFQKSGEAKFYILARTGSLPEAN